MVTEPGLDYSGNLRQLMADHHLWRTTQLVPLLRDRGIGLSPSQIRRLVAGKPERLSMTVLAALCDIFGCTPGDLITIKSAAPRPGAASGAWPPRRPASPGRCRRRPGR